MKYDDEYFTLSEENGILVMTMQAPGNNLMTGEFFDRYQEIISQIRKKTNVKGLIIKGGGRHFSVGADVESLSERSASELLDMKNDYDFSCGHTAQKESVLCLLELPYPVVSTISGFCIGSGSEIAVSSHVRICETNARIGQPESTFGILPGLGGIARTIEVCGFSAAAEMVFTGTLISAQKAYEIGWADILTEKKQSFDEAVALIEWINKNIEKYDNRKAGCYVVEYLADKGETNI